MKFGNHLLFTIIIAITVAAAVKIPAIPFASINLEDVNHFLQKLPFQPPANFEFKNPPSPVMIDRVENDKNLFGTEITYSIKMETPLRLKSDPKESEIEFDAYFFVLLQARTDPSTSATAQRSTNQDEERFLQERFLVLYISPYEYPRLQLRDTLSGILEKQRKADESTLIVTWIFDSFSNTRVTNRIKDLVTQSNEFKTLCGQNFAIHESQGFSYVYTAAKEQVPLFDAATLLINIDSESAKGWYGFIIKTRYNNNLKNCDQAWGLQLTDTQEQKTTTVDLVKFQSKIIPDFTLMRLPQWGIPESTLIDTGTQDVIKKNVVSKYPMKDTAVVSSLPMPMTLLRFAKMEVNDERIQSSEVSHVEILFLQLSIGTETKFAFVTRSMYLDQYYYMNFELNTVYEETVKQIYAVAGRLVFWNQHAEKETKSPIKSVMMDALQIQVEKLVPTLAGLKEAYSTSGLKFMLKYSGIFFISTDGNTIQHLLVYKVGKSFIDIPGESAKYLTALATETPAPGTLETKFDIRLSLEMNLALPQILMRQKTVTEKVFQAV